MSFQPIPLRDFEDRSGISRGDLMHDWAQADIIVSLRELDEIIGVQLMPLPYLEQLLRKVSLAGDPSIYPYQNCVIQQTLADPNALRAGQTFLERPKYLAMLEELPGIFRGFTAPRGISARQAMIILGKNKEGIMAIAHYLPPIIEVNGVSNGDWLLLDGVHRNFLSQQVGTSLEAILVKGVQTQFPCTPNDWCNVSIVDEKPPKQKRFFNLKEELFRDLKYIGIDG